MILVSVLYPNEAGKKFDWKYYTSKHRDLVNRRLLPLKMVRLELARGLGTVQPGAPAPFAAVGQMWFNSMDDFQKALAASGAELMGDIPNFTNIQPLIQIGEVAP